MYVLYRFVVVVVVVVVVFQSKCIVLVNGYAPSLPARLFLIIPFPCVKFIQNYLLIEVVSFVSQTDSWLSTNKVVLLTIMIYRFFVVFFK